MSTLDRFERLAAQARSERAPSISIAPRVLAAIRGAVPRRDDTWTLAAFALVASLAASAVAAVAFEAWESFSDPLAGLYPLLTLVVQ